MKTKLAINFSEKLTTTPLTYRLVKEFDLKVNILKANIDFNHNGHILYEIIGSKEQIEATLQELSTLDLTYRLVDSTIKIDRDICTDCGLCTSVCLSDALTIGEPDWELDFNTENCVGCNNCILVCPSQAIKMNDIL